VWLDNGFPTFRTNTDFVSGLWVRELTQNAEDEGGTFIRNVDKKLLNHTARWHKDLAAQSSRGGNIKLLLSIYLHPNILSSSVIQSCR
jgi:hypothetical protein